jgi:hypothetical protein
LRKIYLSALLSGLFFHHFTPLWAQNAEIFVPLEVQRAYHQSTRTRNGLPGPRYWQNYSDYTIRAELEPASRSIRGKETVVYSNNSPDTLRQLVVRLYPDIFKKGNARDEAVLYTDDITHGVHISRLIVNGNSIELNTARPVAQRIGTNLIIGLRASPLLPGTTLRLEVDWDYTLPKETHIREGTYGENTFFVAYWYPQIAVYDDIDGWDVLDYTGTQEFYNDFSNFDVEIKVPARFLVWATGEWQNPQEVLTETYLGRYQAATRSDEIVHIVTEVDLKRGEITVQQTQNTWKYKAQKVPDFAFATSNRYLWDATSATVDATTGRRTTVSATYDPTSKDFYEVARYGKQSVEYFSSTLPGIPFPYPNLTVFNGSGGMEFPMMVNDGSNANLEDAAEVTAHEIAHTYFPFYMGINERKYAWMDEGWAQFLPNEIAFKAKATVSETFNVQRTNAQYFSYFAGKEMEMPMMIPSNLLKGNAYGMASYFRPAVAYAFLEGMLGKDKFKKVLQEYMRRWNGKHPIPFDFFNSFNDAAGEDLAWFWKPWFFDRGYPDLGISRVVGGKQTRITIDRKGNLPVPIHLKITFADGTEQTFTESIRVWKNGGKEFIWTKKLSKPIYRIRLGNEQVPDVDPRDNVYVEKSK